MSPRMLLDYLATLFPDFRSHWDRPGNCFRNEDGAFSVHGVFAEFTTFFQVRHSSLPQERVRELGEFVSECMAGGDTKIGNAAGTCFVEDIAGEACDRELARHLTGFARRYWRAWGGRDSA